MNEILNSFQRPQALNATDDQLDPSDVGGRIRSLRRGHQMSQRELARLAGMTNGAISMIEKNRVSPSVGSLKKVLDVFGLSLADFFTDNFASDPRVFYRAAEMPRIADGKVVLRQVGANLSRRRLQVLHETYAPGGDTGKEMLSHDGEEAGVIIRGQIEITVGGRTQVLSPGDSYYFSSRLPHRFRNVDQEECELVSVCTPPTF